MAHKLEKNDYMVSGNNTVPWHGLGAVELGLLTAEDALAKAKLNWTVEQEQVFDGDMTEVEGFKLNRRSDDRTVLGIVPATWYPLQNSELLDIAEALSQVDDQGFKPVIETAGSLKGGRIVWALVQTNQKLCAGSEHKTYLLLSMGHDGKRAVRGTLTDTRVVCWNTLSLAESQAQSLFVTHTKNIKQRIDAAVQTLGWANDATKATFAIYDALATCNIGADRAVEYFASLLPGEDEMPTAPAVVGQMYDLFRSGAGNEGKTAFDALNAVTDWVDHKRQFREDTQERRFLYSALGGEGDRLKRTAFNKAKELVA